MAACAENLTPMVAECGGKDAFIVDATPTSTPRPTRPPGAPCPTPGQTCIGVERVYVVEDVYHTFLERLTERAARLRPGEDREADYGPMTMPGQVDVIEQHIADALARGGRPVVGGHGGIRAAVRRPGHPRRRARGEPGGDRGDVRPDDDGHEGGGPGRGGPAGERGRYGLAATVFSGNKKAGDGRGRTLRSGMTAINAVIAFASVPALPFGGIRRLRFRPDPRRGRAAGVLPAEGDHPAAVHADVNLTSFGRTDKDMKKILGLVTLLHGKRYKK